MEKKWPPVKESAAYRGGMLAPFLEKRGWEDDEEYLDKSISYDDEDCEVVYTPRAVKKFLDEMRDSRGYAVSPGMPFFLGSPFLVYYEEENPLFPTMSEPRDEAIQIAVDHISSKTNRPYKYEKLVNFNYTTARTFFLTFTAKDTSLPDAAEETYLAAVYAPLHLGRKGFELLECLQKPDHPAPTTDDPASENLPTTDTPAAKAYTPDHDAPTMDPTTDATATDAPTTTAETMDPATDATATDAPTTTAEPDKTCAEDKRKKHKIPRHHLCLRGGGGGH